MESNKSYFRGSHVGVCFVGRSYLRYPARGANISHPAVGKLGSKSSTQICAGMGWGYGTVPRFPKHLKTILDPRFFAPNHLWRNRHPSRSPKRARNPRDFAAKVGFEGRTDITNIYKWAIWQNSIWQNPSVFEYLSLGSSWKQYIHICCGGGFPCYLIFQSITLS